MTSFKDYIRERTINHDSIVHSITLKIKKDCKPFLKEIGKRKIMLWRGTEKQIGDIKILRRRKDRKPFSSTKYTHQAFDELFLEYHGWKARSEGVFVSSEKDDLFSYGDDSYGFFPIGNYRYLWSPHVQDLWTTAIVRERAISKETIKERFKHMMKNYTDKNLKNSQDSEISFDVDSYFLVKDTYMDDVYDILIGRKGEM